MRHSRLPILPVTAFLCGIAMTGGAFAQDKSPQHRLTYLDGRQISATVIGIDAKGAISLDGQSAVVSLNDLRSIEPVKSPAASESGSLQIGLLADGLLRAKGITLKNEKLVIEGGPANGQTLPLESVRSVLFESKADETFAKAMSAPSEDADRLIVKLRGKLRTVSALTESLTADSATITVDNRTTTIPRGDIHGIVFAYIKKPLDRNGLCNVRLVEGSTLPGRITALANGKLTLRLLGGSEFSVPWNSVVEISITSDRLQYLSDLTPTDVSEQPILAFPRKWQKDRSVNGGVLTLGGAKFKKGLGVHAQSRLTFTLENPFQTLAATIGLDDAAGEKGDCLFIVLGDGKELLRQRVKGTDKPRTISVDIKNVRSLVLLVEPGENLDIADHADWCDAILIRPAK